MNSNAPAQQNPGSSANLPVPVLIYMKSGAIYSVRDYWIIEGELHYVLMNGRQGQVNLDNVDLPRTNEENAKSGVRFILKSEPGPVTPAPDENQAPVPAQPGSGQPSAQPGNPNSEPRPGAPSLQINATPDPQART